MLSECCAGVVDGSVVFVFFVYLFSTFLQNRFNLQAMCKTVADSIIFDENKLGAHRVGSKSIWRFARVNFYTSRVSSMLKKFT